MIGTLNLKFAGFIFCFGLLLVTCVDSQQGSESNEPEVMDIPPVDFDLDKIKERGSLIAIVDNSTTSYFIYKGQPMGYEYELLSLLGEDLGVELQLVITTDIDDAFAKLNGGEGDIVAYNLTVTKERVKRIAFTDHLTLSRQVLIQKKPDNWRQMKLHEIEKQMIRDQLELIGQEIHVRKSSSFVSRLQNLSEEMGGNVIIVEEPGNVEVENLIHRVAVGDIKYTVADENVAKLNATYHKNLDIKTPISFSQRIAWGVRQNSVQLLQATNTWLAQMKKEVPFYTIYDRYFKSSKASLRRVHSDYSTLVGHQLSPYDSLIKKGALELGWDWELLAALIFQESKFDPKADSWVGAKGLMQLMPATAKQFGATDPEDPQQAITSGVNYLKWLDEFWQPKVPDDEERIKFILGSYNVGQGHVLDAQKLSTKYGKDSTIWDYNVAFYLLKKSEPEFYNDPVVSAGYCRGREPVHYVEEILYRSEQYQQLMANQPVLSEL
ncbi:MAG: transporter substrate-binding domain-containing protein [Bacteroidetes bacterium]|nr:MAG: transporter substrate-binding domain-containing protein [Bacteroidota bacterium]